MSNDIFWNWLAFCKSKNKNPSILDFELWLNLLDEYHGGKIVDEFLKKINALDVPLIWCAGSIINGRFLGDDLFLYFRGWIVWEGFEFYNLMIENPDEIVNLEVNLSYIFNEEIVGAMLQFPHQKNSQVQWTHHWSWRDWGEFEMQRSLPNLWTRFGASFKSERVSYDVEASEIDIPDLGLVGVGARVKNKFGKGVGTVQSILNAENYAVLIKYDSGLEERDTLIPFLFEIVP